MAHHEGMSTNAQKAKEKGNAAFRAQNYPEAVGHYTDAILADSSEPTYPLNRAAAYLKLGKAADAERDCSVTLRLSPGHVKALYRRAQARIELDKLDEAKADLSAALEKETRNDAVKSELQKVEKLFSERRRSKITPADVGTAVKQVPPRRRRVPIEVVEPSTQTVQPTDTLAPISSRPLQSKPEETLPTPSPSPARKSPLPSKHDSPPLEPRASSSKTLPTAQGGIFRSSGERTLFRTPETSPAAPETPIFRTIPLDASEDDDAPQPTLISLFEFTRAWELASPSERWDLLCQIPPQAVPALFKTSLEATLLVQILEVFSLALKSSDDPGIKNRVRGYLRWLQRVPRFSTVVLFLSKQEKELSRTLAQTVGSTAWKV